VRRRVYPVALQSTAFLLGLAAAGCVTTSSPISVSNLPGPVVSSFRDCSPGDGFGGIQLYEGSDFLGSAEFDWESPVVDRWNLFVRDPIGQTLIAAERPHGPATVRLSGRLSDALPELTVARETGILELNGYSIGLGVDEVSCVLSGRIPRVWRDAVVFFERVRNENSGAETGTNSFLVIAVREQRRIRMDLTIAPSGELGGSCVVMADARWWVIPRRELKWCIVSGKTKGGEISGFGSYRLRWNIYDQG